MPNKGEEAKRLFMQGYNCAQAVAGAFAEDLGLTEKQAMQLISGFGGGFSRLREVCGAVSGMTMVLSALYGYDTPDDPEEKKALYALVREGAERFKAENGSYICRDLLGELVKQDKPDALPVRDANYYATRPCARMVESAARITQAMMEEHSIRM